MTVKSHSGIRGPRTRATVCVCAMAGLGVCAMACSSFTHHALCVRRRLCVSRAFRLTRAPVCAMACLSVLAGGGAGGACRRQRGECGQSGAGAVHGGVPGGQGHVPHHHGCLHLAGQVRQGACEHHVTRASERARERETETETERDRERGVFIEAGNRAPVRKTTLWQPHS